MPFNLIVRNNVAMSARTRIRHSTSGVFPAVLAITAIVIGTLILFGNEETDRALIAINVPSACSPPSVPYGEPMAADALSNLRIGHDVRNLSYRFRAIQSGNIRAVRVYLKTGNGYSSGNGGTMRIDLVSEDPGVGNIPSGKVLGSAFAPDVLRIPFNRMFDFEPAVHVAEGNYYHLVFSNNTANPITDFVSINSLVLFGATEPQLKDMSVLTRQALHSPWLMRQDLLPIFALEYKSGDRQGQGYIDALSESGRYLVEGSNQVRERIRVKGPDMKVQSVQVRVRNPRSSVGDLRIALEEDGKPLAEGEVQVPGGPYRWISHMFPAPLTLRSNETYYLILSSRSGVETFPVQGGVRYGFDVPSLLRDGVFEINTDHTWTTPRHELQMQFYFCQLFPAE